MSQPVLVHLSGAEHLVGPVASPHGSPLKLGVFTVFVTALAVVANAFGHVVAAEIPDFTSLGMVFALLSVACAAALIEFGAHCLPSRIRASWTSLRWLVVANAAIVGIAAEVQEPAMALADRLMIGSCSAIAFVLTQWVFLTLRARVVASKVPCAWRGTPLDLAIIGLMALAASCVEGLQRHL